MLILIQHDMMQKIVYIIYNFHFLYPLLFIKNQKSDIIMRKNGQNLDFVNYYTEN